MKTKFLLSLFLSMWLFLSGPIDETRTKTPLAPQNPFKDSLEREDLHCQFSNTFDLVFLSKMTVKTREADSSIYYKIKNQRFGQKGILSLVKSNSIFENESYTVTALWVSDEPGTTPYWFIDCFPKSRAYSQSNLAVIY